MWRDQAMNWQLRLTDGIILAAGFDLLGQVDRPDAIARMQAVADSWLSHRLRRKRATPRFRNALGTKH
ncbi:MAG TPA: hypothetical protein VEW05_28150 [Candidatus Polarisedimenticolia bacterium]|nr:hypothetical protein [Candidatus Polarisedimenticolia bacterium]